MQILSSAGTNAGVLVKWLDQERWSNAFINKYAADWVAEMFRQDNKTCAKSFIAYICRDNFSPQGQGHVSRFQQEV